MLRKILNYQTNLKHTIVVILTKQFFVLNVYCKPVWIAFLNENVKQLHGVQVPWSHLQLLITQLQK